MKKVEILYTEYAPVIDAIKYQLQDCEIDCLTEPNNNENYDLVINFGVKYDGEALACHYSLLPAFNVQEPVKEAILAGVKVTGITIFYTKSKKIVAQYPVFIKNYSHYDDIEQELKYVEQALFPLVIQKVLKNEFFDAKELLKGGCAGNCGGCNGCNR